MDKLSIDEITEICGESSFWKVETENVFNELLVDLMNLGMDRDDATLHLHCVYCAVSSEHGM